MRWDLPSTEVQLRPFIDREYSGTTTISDSSLDISTGSPSNRFSINNNSSELGVFSPVLDDMDPGTVWQDLGEPSQARLHTACRSPTLTRTQVKELEAIAMPFGIRTMRRLSGFPQSPIASSPEPELAATAPHTNKRKHCRTEEQKVVADKEVSYDQMKRNGHNAIEKKYRANLNEKIHLLRQSLPNLKILNEGDLDNSDDGRRTSPDREKYGKAAVIARATKYITFLENKNKEVSLQTALLNTRIDAFERLAISGSFNSDNRLPATPSETAMLETITNGVFHNPHYKPYLLREADFPECSDVEPDMIKIVKSQSKSMKSDSQCD